MLFTQEFPQGMTEGRLNATRGETQPLCVEFKYELSSILPEFDSEVETSKQFNDINVLIAWKGEGFNEGISGDYLLESCSFNATVHDRVYIGQTHKLLRAGSSSSIPVILLKDLFQMSNYWERGQAVQQGSYYSSD